MDVVLRLKEFCLLEMFQVGLFQSQLGSLENDYVRHVYERMIEVESRHVDFYKKMLNEYTGDVPLFPAGGLSTLAGRFLGEVLDLTSAGNRYRLGVAVETKAIEMYRAFIIESAPHPDLQKKLWLNMVDEEFHLLWFKDNLKHNTSLVKST